MSRKYFLRNKLEAAVVFVVAMCFVLPGASSITNLSSDNFVTADEAQTMLDTHTAVLLDVQETQDQSSVIKGAVAVSLSQLGCGSCVDKLLSTYDTIIVYSANSDIRTQAAEQLRLNKYTVYELTEPPSTGFAVTETQTTPNLLPNERYTTVQLSTTDAVVSAYEREGRIRRLYGEAFAHGSSVQETANQFLADNAHVLGVNVEELSYEKQLPIMYDQQTGQYKFTGVYYTQYKNDIPVYEARLILLIKNQPDYPLVLASVDLRDLRAYDVPIQPETFNIQNSITTVQDTITGITQFTEPELVIWAGYGDKNAEPVVAYTFIGEGSGGKYTFVTDATTGEILYKENMILFVDVTGNVQGKATEGKGADFCENEVPTPFKWARVGIGTTYAYTDANGNFVITNGGTSPVTVDSPIRGRWFTVTNESGPSTILHKTVTPPGPANFMHNNGNTNEMSRAEVNGYVQANVVRDFTLTYDPSYPGLTQTEFPVYVNWVNDPYGYCPGNAWYDYSSINFCKSGSGYPNTAWSTVIHHEYGHHLVDQAGSGQGAYGEGMGDVMGMLITDDSGTGYGFYGDCNTPLREADNTMQYPCSGEIHYCGQLLSGCVWSTRVQLEITNPTTYLSIISSLAVNAMKLHTGEGIDPSITIDYLILDDDNVNIYDGTPHYNEIAAGFGAHNMDAPPLNLLSFSFPNGLPEYVSSSGGTTVRVVVSALSGQPQPGTGKIYINTGSGYQQYSMNQVSPNVYDGVFPSATCPTLVSYYFSAQTTGGQTQYYPNDAPTSVLYTVAAGAVEESLYDDFQTNLGWTVTNQGISTGAWTRAVPACGGSRGDPPSAFGGSGYCYVTDNRCPDYDIDGGYTYLISPTMDLSGWDGAKVSYALWYTNDYGANPNANYFKTYVSNNNGASWVLAETIGPTTPQPYAWYMHQVLISNYVTLTNQMKIRFEASDVGSGAVVEAGIDEVTVSVIECHVSAFLLQGQCYYPDMNPADTITVEVTNLDTGEEWQASTENNQYSLIMYPGSNLNEGDTLQIIARDNDESVNITMHTVTAEEISAGGATVDLIVDVHYRDLKMFPYYLSTVDTGASTMKAMLDYLMWNSTVNPLGPPSVYNEQTLYNTYKGLDMVINGDEITSGLNTEIDDLGHGWIYGYFFAPSARETIDDALKDVIIWVDFDVSIYNEYRDVDVPKPGHPYHVPVAMPLDGTYNHWVAIRGIHSSQNSWNGQEVVTDPISIYGFWVNDPKSGGLGSDTYVTAQRFIDTYFSQINVVGDTYYHKYLVVTDPYIQATVDSSTAEIQVTHNDPVFTIKESQLMQRAVQIGKDISSTNTIKKLVETAYQNAYDVLKYDTVYGPEFVDATPQGKPVYRNGEYTIRFSSPSYDYRVCLSRLGNLLEIQIQ